MAAGWRKRNQSQLHLSRTTTRERKWSLIAGIAVTLGLMCVITYIAVYQANQSALMYEQQVKLSAAKAAALRVGSITILPMAGDECREGRFDNWTGSIIYMRNTLCQSPLGVDANVVEVPPAKEQEPERIKELQGSFRR